MLFGPLFYALHFSCAVHTCRALITDFHRKKMQLSIKAKLGLHDINDRVQRPICQT